MLTPDCHDNTPQEVLDCEQQQPSGQKKCARKIKHMLKADRYRLYLDEEQERLLKKHFGCVRRVYYGALELKSDHNEQTKKSLSKSELQGQLVAKKKNPEFVWLNEVNSQSLLAALLRGDSAFQGFLKHKRGYPKFKRKTHPQQPFQYPQHFTVDFEEEYSHLPKINCSFESRIKTVTVITATPCRHDDDRVLVDETQHSVAPVVQEITLENTLGIDLGLNNFLIDSDGHKINNPRLLKNSLKTLRVQQRTVDLVKTHHTAFVVEDLNIKGTVKNRKLARTLHNVGWGQLLLFLSYKCEQAGKTVHNIGRYEPRSKVCSCCSDKMTMSIVRSAP